MGVSYNNRVTKNGYITKQVNKCKPYHLGSKYKWWGKNQLRISLIAQCNGMLNSFIYHEKKSLREEFTQQLI